MLTTNLAAYWYSFGNNTTPLEYNSNWFTLKNGVLTALCNMRLKVMTGHYQRYTGKSYYGICVNETIPTPYVAGNGSGGSAFHIVSEFEMKTGDTVRSYADDGAGGCFLMFCIISRIS